MEGDILKISILLVYSDDELFLLSLSLAVKLVYLKTQVIAMIERGR